MGSDEISHHILKVNCPILVCNVVIANTCGRWVLSHFDEICTRWDIQLASQCVQVFAQAPPAIECMLCNTEASCSILTMLSFENTHLCSSLHGMHSLQNQCGVALIAPCCCYCWMCHGLELLGQRFRGHIHCAVFCELALCQSNAPEPISIVLYSVVPGLCLDHPSESSIV